MGKHKEWRKLAKKLRRKRIRQELAAQKEKERELEQTRRELSPTYCLWLKNQEQAEEFQAQEEERLANLREQEWLKQEEKAQKEWMELQLKLEKAREERVRQNERIKQEWDLEQKRLKKLKELKETQEEEKRKHEELLKEQIENFIKHGGEVPQHLKTTLETNPNKPVCPFFKKTGACRFKDTCSRNHIRPGISKIILIPNFYSHYSLEQAETEHGSDSMLEFESHEIYSHFKDFFNDVVSEMEKCGRIKQFKVCCNAETHLRGNVYIEYESYQEAVKSYKIFQGRWYGGKQLNVEFCSLESWKSAICGQFYKKTCPKGSACNFLHVFRNPNNLYHYSEKDYHKSSPAQERESLERNWRWSESPERIRLTEDLHEPANYKHHSRNKEKHHHKNGNHKNRCGSKHLKRHRSRSRSPSNYRTKSQSRDRSSKRHTSTKYDSSRSEKSKHHKYECNFQK